MPARTVLGAQNRNDRLFDTTFTRPKQPADHLRPSRRPRALLRAECCQSAAPGSPATRVSRLYGLISVRSRINPVRDLPPRAAAVHPQRLAPLPTSPAYATDVARLSELPRHTQPRPDPKTVPDALETVIGAPAQSPLGADLEGSRTPSPHAARLESTTELNTTPTSYTPSAPRSTAASTSLPTIGGVYSRENGSQTLTFR